MNSNTYGCKTPRLHREATLCKSSAQQISALSPEIENSRARNPFSDYFVENWVKLTRHTYQKILRDGISWQDAEDIVSLLPLDIATGHFDKLLTLEERQQSFWQLSSQNQRRVAGCIHHRLNQQVVTFYRGRNAKKRDYKLTVSCEQIPSSTLEKFRLQKDYSPSPDTLIQKEEQLLVMRHLLKKIDDVYPLLYPRDRAILDAMRRIPLGKKINARSIYEAMTHEEWMLFVDHAQIPVVIDGESIIRAIYRRLRKLPARIQGYLKKRS